MQTTLPPSSATVM